MDYFVKFKEGEELELKKGIVGLHNGEVWAIVGFNHPQASLPEPYKRHGSADGIESLFIRITKKLWKKISEMGLIYFTNNDFEVQKVLKKEEYTK